MNALALCLVTASVTLLVTGLVTLWIARRHDIRRRPPLPSPAWLMDYSTEDLVEHLARVCHELETRVRLDEIRARWAATRGDR